MQCGHNGNITWGAQSEPRSSVATATQLGPDSLQRLWLDCRDNMSYCVAYTPAGASPYSATLAGSLPRSTADRELTC